MPKEQIIEVAALYLSRLVALGAEVVRLATMDKPYQGESEKDALKNHLAWMCDRLIKLAEDGEVEKAGRWLGFVQGCLYMFGEYSIDEMRTHNGRREIP